MERGKPCCPAAAARMVRKLRVGDGEVGMVELDAVFEEARRLLPASDEALRATLLARARIFNYIPPNAEGDYAEALLREFKMTCGKEGQV